LSPLGGRTRDALRAALRDAGYTADAVAEPRRLQRFVPPDEALPADTAGAVDSRLSALVSLLALGPPVRVAEARSALGAVAIEDLQAAGLLAVEREDVISNYCLLPHEALLLAGDVPSYRDREVVQAWTNPTLTLARTTPRTPRRSMLDLGTGSGVAALRQAAHCDQVTGVEINPGALMLAGFNAHLNDIANVELLEGSCFEPVSGRRFDLIVGNPPYVVSPDHEFTYGDSGVQGGALLERACAARRPRIWKRTALGSCWQAGRTLRTTIGLQLRPPGSREPAATHSSCAGRPWTRSITP
jgi:Methyltransferase small domain